MQLRVFGLVSGCVCGFAAVLGILPCGSPLRAATYYWTASAGTMVGGSGTWDTAAAPFWSTSTTGDATLSNWSGVGTDTAEFYTGSGTVAVNNTQSVGAINFDAGTNYTLSGGTLDMSAGGATITTNGAATISSAINGNGGLTINGVGALTLSGSNSYTGPTVINGGVLKLAGGAPGGYVAYYGFTGGTANNSGIGGPAYNGQLFGTAAISPTGGVNGGPCMTLPSASDMSGLYLGTAGVPTTGVPASNGVFTASLWFYGLYDGSGYRSAFMAGAPRAACTSLVPTATKTWIPTPAASSPALIPWRPIRTYWPGTCSPSWATEALRHTTSMASRRATR